MVWMEDLIRKLRKGDKLKIIAPANGHITNDSKLNKRMCTVHAKAELEIVRIDSEHIVAKCDSDFIQPKVKKRKAGTVTVNIPMINLWKALSPDEKKRLRYGLRQ